MDFNIEVRRKQLQSLDQYITSSKDKVQSILNCLGWNSKTVLENDVKFSCSLNANHHIPVKCKDEHLNKCYLKTSGYDEETKFLSEPLHDPTSSIKLDNTKKLEVISGARRNKTLKTAWNGNDPDPMTSDRLISTFSVDERLALYDYCVKHAKGPTPPPEFNVNIDYKKEKKLTAEEALIKERDVKRRPTKYKSVHTDSNKSHTEVLREVINNQMESYKEYLTSVTNIENTNTCSNEQNEQYLKYSTDEYNSQYQTYADERIDCHETLDTDRPHSSFSRHSTHSCGSRSKKDSESYKSDERKRPRRDYYEKRYDRHEHSPHREKRRDRDYRESRESWRSNRDYYYKSEYKRS